jgi:2-polyprenyl-3-methyl-5-hydroxy-6-metoxy-1,4-benzoquinol methylase
VSSASPYISTCPLECGIGFDATAIALPEGPLLRCRACGQLVSQVDAQAYHESMLEFDDPCGTAPDERSARRRETLARRRLARLHALLDKPRDEIHLLDVGCSSGTFLESAGRFGVRAQGVEPAAQAAASARAAGFEVFTGTLDEARFPAHRFDAITLFEVIEHLASPLALVRECWRILKPGGIILIGTGNSASWTARWMGAHWDYLSIARHGGHVSFFSTVSMRILAKRCGFRVARMETRNVSLHRRDDGNIGRYLLTKGLSGLANYPARWLGRGHDMLAYLRKPV